jgi:hypothetical protein
MLADANTKPVRSAANACWGALRASRLHLVRHAASPFRPGNGTVLALGPRRSWQRTSITPATAALSCRVEQLGSVAGMVHADLMPRQITPESEDVNDALGDEVPATEEETRALLLKRSKRTNAPVPSCFIQNPNRRLKDRSAPLAEFVKNGDLRGLRALLFLHVLISSDKGDNGWSTTLPLAVWARVFDTTKTASNRSSSTAATKILTRLVGRELIARSRTGRARTITVTLLRPDGSGDPYTRPDGKVDKFIKLNNEFWTDGWFERLDMPATAMLLVALHEKPGFELPTEHVPAWYGWSADTAQRGLKALIDEGLLDVRKRIKKAPLSPTGATEVNIYTLVGVLTPERASKNKANAKTDGTKRLGKKTTVTMGSGGESRLSKKYAHLPEVLAGPRVRPAKRPSNPSSATSRSK